MSAPESLKSIVSAILQVPADTIHAETPLRTGRLKTSIGGGILDAAIRRRLGVTTEAAYTATMYAQLEAAVNGEPVSYAPESAADGAPTPDATPPSPPASAFTGELACGIDIEMIDSLPQADDYWDAEFYRHAFTHAEIAYCVSQDDPRPHFAARWCAKEALKKCGARYLGLDLAAIEVVLDDDGRPWLRVASHDGWAPVPGAVSLSHTTSFATAMVVLATAV